MLSVSISVGIASLDTAIANTALPALAEQLHGTCQFFCVRGRFSR